MGKLYHPAASQAQVLRAIDLYDYCTEVFGDSGIF